MEQFLNLGQVTEKTIAEFQEAQDPRLRCRIHQLSTILQRRNARKEFIDGIRQERISLWDGILQVTALYDPLAQLEPVHKGIAEMVRLLQSTEITTPRIAALMRDQEFTVPEEDILDVELFLVDQVFETRYGSAPLLCALAQHLAAQVEWSLTTVLHMGRFCLIDRDHLLLDPVEGWHISKLGGDDKIHPCGRRDVLLDVLLQLFLIALVEGHLRDLYHFGDLLTALNGFTVEDLPFPLGREKPPVSEPAG
ncbi:MAG: hypothetical protein A3K18_00035 [Lentisphaerae bacterium RIFOXYA12_64_32]|nr:MAG: hypothetical protein A3K18_00035 [Lentisphaerae bacterium RIFOXYA12_64_32]